MSSLPLRPMILAALVGALLLVLDALARRFGLYDATLPDWPAVGRLRQAESTDPSSPYRAAQPATWEPALPGGIPRAVSVALLPVVAFAFLWTICVVLALCDLPAALKGWRHMDRTLASLALCVARAVTGWGCVGAALGQRRTAFAAMALGALVLDASLARWAIPCSDTRASDVAVAQAGVVVDALLVFGFSWTQWRRLRLQPPPAPRAITHDLN